MRGKEWFRDENLQQPGITPAYAGKSALMPAVMAGSQDHPRVCGEKRLVKRRARCLGGSPPRMRGKDLCDVICGQQSGITPAYAGKRYPYQYAEYCIGDHPRVCGEKTSAMSSAVSSPGSPPRMRGKGTLTNTLNTVSGITPAYAGKSRCGPKGSRKHKDHPRVCGEKTLA